MAPLPNTQLGPWAYTPGAARSPKSEMSHLSIYHLTFEHPVTTNSLKKLCHRRWNPDQIPPSPKSPLRRGRALKSSSRPLGSRSLHAQPNVKLAPNSHKKWSGFQLSHHMFTTWNWKYLKHALNQATALTVKCSWNSPLLSQAAIKKAGTTGKGRKMRGKSCQIFFNLSALVWIGCFKAMV